MKFMAHLLTLALWALIGCGAPAENTVDEIQVEPVYEQFEKKGGYEIKVKINNLKDTTVFLAFYLGNSTYMKDTARVDANGVGVFQSDSALPQGIYLVVLPRKTYFDVVVGENQHFYVENDTNPADFVKNFKSTGSLENEIFYGDIRFIAERSKKREEINKQINDLEEKKKAKEAEKKNNEVEKLKEEVEKLKEELVKLDDEVKANRKLLIAKYPGTLFSRLLKVMEEVPTPESPKKENGDLVDSNFAYNYYKAHYFDNYDFADARLLRTPILHNKVEYYLDKVCIQHYDTIIGAVELIVQSSKKDEEAYKYWVITLLNKYANSNVMGHEAVYVHIAKKYYTEAQAYWLDKAEKYRIMDRALKMEPTLLDKPAPALALKDINGKMVNLYSIQAEYVMVMFYDPDCGHCKKEAPLFKAAYDSLKNMYDLKVVAVSITSETEKWKKFIKEFGIEDWTHLADIERVNNFREIYDLQSTPRLFLLDRGKFIRGKRFAPDQLADLLKQLERVRLEKEKKK